jgi:hypothetical protein
MPVSSTPINTLPSQNEPEPVLSNEQKEHENELVSEILNEINQNDTQQTSMKEPPTFQMLEPEPPIQNIQTQVDYQPQEIVNEPMNYEVPLEDVSLLETVKKEVKSPLLVSVTFILLSLPQVRSLIQKIVPQRDILVNNLQSITTVLLGLVSGLVFYFSNKYLS